jgi:hypothetical protein
MHVHPEHIGDFCGEGCSAEIRGTHLPKDVRQSQDRVFWDYRYAGSRDD